MVKEKVPKKMVNELKLKQPKKLEEEVTLIEDSKYTRQFSIKLPARIMSTMGWQGGNKIIVTIDGKQLVLRQKVAS
jgi:hypothetical protein